MRGMYTLLKKRNPRLMKDNARIYRNIRLSRLQMKRSNPKSQSHQKLETLAEVAIRIFGPEVACETAANPNPRKSTDTSKGKHQNL